MILSRRFAVAGLTVSAAVRAEPLPAALNSSLYQATAIVTGTDMRQRPFGFAQCLIEVLTKLTGRPDLASNPAIANLADHADALVASYAYIDPRAALLHHDD